MMPFEPGRTTEPLRPIDRHLGRLLRAHAPGARADLVAFSGALCSAELAAGNVCMDLSELAGGRHPEAPELALPALAEWAGALRECALVGDGSSITPLVLDEAGRLYLYRYWAAERRLASRLAGRLAGAEPVAPADRLAQVFRRLFKADGDTIDRQAVAAAACLRSRFAVVTGGPGTGKTTLAAKLITLFLTARPTLRIALAAPTGKAAKRLTTSIGSALSSLPVPEVARAALPEKAVTVHRLLKYHGGADTLGYDAERPLPLDLVLVDEASMVDLLLMDALAAALPPTCRLVLLGDSRQLASVDAGFVLGDICSSARTDAVSPGLAGWFAELSGQTVDADPSAGALDDAVTELTRSWRFHPEGGIGRLSAAINAGDVDGTVAALEDDPSGEVRWRASPEPVVETHIEFARTLCRSRPAEEAFGVLGRHAVLCAHRVGPGSVDDINDRVERELSRAGLIGRGRYYGGRPVLISANAYSVELFNGDLGLCWYEGSRLSVYFDAGDGTLRSLPPVRLPAHETAWAMTVHKSQGSEFDEVAVVLPEGPSRLLGRELLYTAVTRARQHVTLAASRESLARAVASTVRRRTGLRQALLRELAEIQSSEKETLL